MRNYSFLALLIVLLSGCFRPPEFPDEPEIEFNNIVFKPGTEGDTLKLSVDFKDGDGDLGLTGLDDNFPYHPIDIIIDSNGDTVFFKDGIREFDGRVKEAIPPFFRLSPNGDRELFSETDNRPDVFTCLNYEFLNAEITKTVLLPNGQTIETTDDIRIDSFFVVPNALHNNFYVEIKRKVNGQYVDFDFRNVARNDFCGDDFNGRFPILDQRNLSDGSPLAGTLDYNMFSIGFNLAFRRDTFRIDASIRDRSLNLSNTVSTPDFTLESITED